MNQYKAKVEVLRHQMQLRAGMTSDNPYHNQHIREFCDYVDYSIAAMIEDLRQAIPAMIQAELAKPKVAIQVDEKSFQAAKKKVDELFRGIGRLFR